MAAMFAGASRALLASVVFAFETTRQPLGLLPLLGGCTRGVPGLVPADAQLDHDREDRAPRRARARRVRGRLPRPASTVRDRGLRGPVTTLRAERRRGDGARLARVRRRRHQHQGFPVVDERGQLVGVVTRRDLLAGRRRRRCASASSCAARPWSSTTTHAARGRRPDGARNGIGRLPVVSRAAPRTLVGILTRSDLVDAHAERLDEDQPRAHPS